MAERGGAGAALARGAQDLVLGSVSEANQQAAVGAEAITRYKALVEAVTS